MRNTGTWLGWVLAVLGAAVFAWLIWRIDYAAFLAAVANANLGFVLLVPAAILLEQWLAAGKWKLLLATLGGARLSRVFAANMAAFLAGYVVPAVGSPVVRSWLLSRSEGLRFTSVLASIAVDRAVDAAAFVFFAVAAILLIGLPQSGESLRVGVIAAVAGSGAVLAICVTLLIAFRRTVRGGRAAHVVSRLPERWRERAARTMDLLAEGAAWPRSAARAAAVVLLAFCVKALAATHLFWAGVALGAPLGPPEYLLVMVLLGFVHVLGRFVRIPGTFILAATFLLELFGVDPERALAMALIVQVSALVTISALGALALVWFGAELRELKASYRR